jgi:predicted transcriptional regulator
MEQLTRAELQVMQVLWKLGKAFAKDVMARMPKPRPAITTVSTVLRILEQKGFVGHTAYGKSHQYHPLVKKEDYGDSQLKRVVKDWYDGSLQGLVSSFVEKNDLDVRELDGILALLKAHKKR